MFTVDYAVIPVDLSTHSRDAWELAKTLGDSPRLHLVHAWGGWPEYLQNVLFPYAPLGEDVVEFEHEIAVEAESAIYDYFDLPAELPDQIDDPAVIRGYPRDVLPEHIQGIGADLVVVGAHGESGVLPHAIGSVTERLIRTARRPVLVARKRRSKPDIERMTVALDLSSGSHVVLQHAIGLAMQLDAELETVYVLPNPLDTDTTQVLSSVIDFVPEKARKQARGRIDAHFDSVVKNLDIPFSHKDEVARLLKDRKLLVGDPAAELIRHAAENDRDLVVVGSQDAARGQNQRIGDVAGAILRDVTCHTLVIPL